MDGKERAQYVVQQRDQGQTLEKIGKELGLTRERVRQIEVQARRQAA